MKRQASLTVIALVLFPVHFLAETIYPKPLRVEQICGHAVVAGQRLELRKEPKEQAVAVTTSDKDGLFSFHQLAAGRYWLVLPGLALQDGYPIELRKAIKNAECKHPLLVTISQGSESLIEVSLQKDTKRK